MALKSTEISPYYLRLLFVLYSNSIDVNKIEEDSLKQETEALKSQLETVERLNDTLRFDVF